MSRSLFRLALAVGVLGTTQILFTDESSATTPSTIATSALKGASREHVAKMLLLPIERQEFEIARREIWFYANGQQVVFLHGRVADHQRNVVSPLPPQTTITSPSESTAKTDDKLAFDIFKEIQTLASTASGRDRGNTASPNARLRVPSFDDESSEESSEE